MNIEVQTITKIEAIGAYKMVSLSHVVWARHMNVKEGLMVLHGLMFGTSVMPHMTINVSFVYLSACA